MKPERDLVPTPAQTVGPFFAIALTTDKPCLSCVALSGAQGERVWVRFRVLDGDGAPVDDAMVEIWQADANGKYNHPDDPQPQQLDLGWTGFGRLATIEDGSCVLETIKPGRVVHGTPEAPHLAVAVFARGMLKPLYTRVYFAGDAANRDDPVLQLVPPERRETLLARPDPSRREGYWKFDLRLQGDQETVFFDL